MIHRVEKGSNNKATRKTFGAYANFPHLANLVGRACRGWLRPGSARSRYAQATPPFDMSPAAVAARAAVYSVPGRANLTGVGSPLKPSMKIDFFGDSITWLNGYVSNIQTAINIGSGNGGQAHHVH